MDQCPSCQGTNVARCKCFRGDRHCGTCGQRWHPCAVHGTVVLGATDHSKPYDRNKCDCNTKKEFIPS